MTIIKNGKEKVFFLKCCGCATEFTYQLDDVFPAKIGELDCRVIRCPVCGNIECATLLTEEEFAHYKNLPRYPYFGSCGASV